MKKRYEVRADAFVLYSQVVDTHKDDYVMCTCTDHIKAQLICALLNKECKKHEGK